MSHAPPVADPAPANSSLMDRARALSEELHDLFQERRRNFAAIAHRLGEMKRLNLHTYLGYSSLAAYAWERHGLKKSQSSELSAISLASEELPAIRAAFDAGALEWTKARELCKVATPETEQEWLERARTTTADDLRADRKGEPRRIRRGLSFSSETAAEYDQLLAGIRKELGVVTDGEAVLELMRRGASGPRGEAPVTRLVINECPTCRAATTDSREGPVRLGPAAVEQARCDGELHDLREEPSTIVRCAPAAVRRRVFDRDHRRCLVPGCRNMASLELHHEDGWRSGHDAERMLTLCWNHHRARHLGILRIDGTAPNFRFRLLDGSILNPSRMAEFSHENSRLGSVPDAPSVSLVGTDVIQDATLALRGLGMRPSEVNQQIQAVLARGSGAPWTAGELVRTILQAA